ncbi:MAG: signal peptidase II [Balneolales bacterium]
MDNKRKKITVFGVVAVVVLLLDQLTKYWIRTSPEFHYHTLVEGWLAINFTKNPGMAMGIHWADTWIISLIAITATGVILLYVWKTLNFAHMGYMVCMGLIVGGALGNITDRIFMARIGGYGGVLDGHVIDFIHFNLQVGDFDVFPYIFNLADSAISVAILTLIVFYKKLMPEYSQHHETGTSGELAKSDSGRDGLYKTGVRESESGINS